MNGQSDQMCIGESKTLAIKFIFEKTVFFGQIIDDGLSSAVEPTVQSDSQMLEGSYDVCQ